ncbi:lactate dehydrogenase [Altererythrobacter aurantiacus]|uniref:site-specific DNA-methyltransferase (adenine-specific) n=1 Tax=Parapontixanthobacter aurantiacus TaxID=1463599 RepID=A0A844ZJM4_9SPHN|nr:class I SAM-dependent DNA methyltransferase [Parapontixanthobacter aurantiacus]MXO87107.1 lactate dehydrogenase [Parapontixanthobacter aurantiacus]
MNPVEIEEAVSQLASEPFDPAEFPFQFLTAFGNKKTTIDRLRKDGKGGTNQSDLAGGVLQRSNIHIATCGIGDVGRTLTALRESPKTATNKAKFILATDGEEFQAEDLISGETVACQFTELRDNFVFFFPLAGINSFEGRPESAFDIKATKRLNKLYLTLLQDNPEWATAERRTDMNHFMARLIFCFFAEDTDIFPVTSRFTQTVERMSAGGEDNTAEVILELFRAMNIKHAERETSGIARWANGFPYVNGNLFSGTTDVPRFSKIARSYLIHIGNLDWTKINPDIFGSMIQAVADDEERGALGMHYTSVPNILNVLNPLFLDDLRSKLEEAGSNSRKLLNLRSRMAKVRVFDPACGSGNFLVIAYKEMRAIEAEINKRRGEADRKTEIPLTNFRGIELRDFPAEIARLALIIAEYQSDVLYRGQKEALAVFLPLDSENWITCGNALRLDWLSICPPTGTGAKVRGDDLFKIPIDQSEIDFVNAGGETFICGNPPYLGDKLQSKEQKSDIERLFSHKTNRWKSFDYICGFFEKAGQFIRTEPSAKAAFVSTNSINQGVQAAQFWPLILNDLDIIFAHTSFKWSNLAAHNAGVICVIVGIGIAGGKSLSIIDGEQARTVDRISPYLTAGDPVYVIEARSPITDRPRMLLGNVPKDGGALLYSEEEEQAADENVRRYLRPLYGSQEFIKGFRRYCLWLDAHQFEEAAAIPALANRFDLVRKMRLESKKGPTRQWALKPYSFVEVRSPQYRDVMVVPRVSSESREFLPIGFLPRGSVVLDSAFGLYDPPLWVLSVIGSRLHLAWIAVVCGKLKTDFRYSNTMGWNTFPLPKLTEQNKADLTRCAENILLAREAHFPAPIAELYDPEAMPHDLRRAHEENDEALERIYIGRRFRNDTERLEKLFELYNEMMNKVNA